MKIAVIGTGYVGLVAGAGFSDFDHHVTCVDINKERIENLKKGEIPIYEPRLKELVQSNIEHSRLHFTTDTKEAVKGCKVVFIAVGTPSDEDGSADLSHVLKATEDIAIGLDGDAVIVNKSTVPVGTGDLVRKKAKEFSKHKIGVASNPEFLKEGDAVNDFMSPSRVIIGSDDEWTIPILQNLYEPFFRTRNRVIVMDQRSAELTKYASNAMLATRISFMNEMSRLAEKCGADIEAVRRGTGSDPRIGNQFLYAGVGFGGSCFPKDIKALLKTSKEHDVKLELVAAAQSANEIQKRWMAQKIRSFFGGDLKNKKLAFWGLSFKPKTDDIRESPSILTIESLLDSGASISAYDPEAMQNSKIKLSDRIEFAGSMYDATKDADALVLMTEWHVFRRPNFEKLKSLMKSPILFDGRNIWKIESTKAHGFQYVGIGRKKNTSTTSSHL